jgi:hypothetical protein
MRPRVQNPCADVPEPHEQLDEGVQQLLGIERDIAQQKPQRGQTTCENSDTPSSPSPASAISPARRSARFAVSVASASRKCGSSTAGAQPDD